MHGDVPQTEERLRDEGALARQELKRRLLRNGHGLRWVALCPRARPQSSSPQSSQRRATNAPQRSAPALPTRACAKRVCAGTRPSATPAVRCAARRASSAVSTAASRFCGCTCTTTMTAASHKRTTQGRAWGGLERTMGWEDGQFFNDLRRARSCARGRGASGRCPARGRRSGAPTSAQTPARTRRWRVRPPGR